jgi:hypothetical protein
MTQRLITALELQESPTGFSWSDISELGTTTAIEAIEQANVIDRASGIVRGYLDQDPTATIDTETARLGSGSVKAWVDNSGWLWFKTDRFPILSLTSLKWATVPAGTGGLTYNAIPSANVLIYGEDFRLNRLADFSQDWTWLRNTPGLVQGVYVNGWPNMLLQASIASTGSKQATVDTTTGLTTTAGAIGNQLTVYDGASTEVITVVSVDDATHFTAVFANTHAISATNPVGISALPSDLKQGAIWTCLAIARVRGEDAIQMDSSGNIKGAPSGFDGDAWAKAEYVLERFRRIP